MLAEIIILIGAVIGLAYFAVGPVIWISVMAVLLLGFSIWGALHGIILFFFWAIFLLVSSVVLFKKLRIQYFTLPLIRKLRSQLPPISQTEREAIAAGNVWWEKELFGGRPHWQNLFNIPKPSLSAEEQSFIDNQVEHLCGMLDDWQIVQDHDLPLAVWDYLKEERFFGMAIPKEYGGHQFSALAHSTIILKIATRSVSAAVNTMVPNSLGPAELLLHYGTEEQKNYYLPRLAGGIEIPCFGLTSPEAGSDAGSIKDQGIVCYGEYEGKRTLGIRLTWDKRYITLAPVATLLGLAVRLYDPENILQKGEDLGITLCLVNAGLAGVEIGNRHLPLYLAFMNGPTRGEDIFVPMDAVIGGVDKVGQGWMMLMECLSIGRAISLPALSAACGSLAYKATGAYASIRRQFNTAIANFEGVEEALSEIAGLTYTTEACRIMTAGAVDEHIKPSVASAIAKYHMTEMARQVIAHAMDIHAGFGIQVGPRNYLAQAHLAIPVSITVEGANILTRNLIIFGQGAIRCHPYILKEIELFALPETPETTEQLDQTLMSHIGYAVSNFARSLWMGLTGGLFIFSPVKGFSARYYRQMTRMSAALALLSDLSMMLLGGALKRKERISARLGDMLSQLYLASSVLKYFHDQGEPKEDQDYVKWTCENALYKIQFACDELLQNFPIKGLGMLMHAIIFPFGRAYKKPKDILSHRIVEAMLIPSELREKLTCYCYAGKDDQDALYRLEKTFLQLIHIEPILKKFQIGIRNGKVLKHANRQKQIESGVEAGVITSDEAKLIQEYETLQKQVIQVDEFSFDLKTIKE